MFKGNSLWPTLYMRYDKIFYGSLKHVLCLLVLLFLFLFLAYSWYCKVYIVPDMKPLY